MKKVACFLIIILLPVAVFGFGLLQQMGSVPSGGATYPCTDCTTDGDGSTSLDICEQFDGEAIECTSGWTDNWGDVETYPSNAGSCGNSYMLDVGTTGIGTSYWTYSTDDHSVCVKFRITEATGIQSYILAADAASNRSWAVQDRGNETIRFYWFDNAENEQQEEFALSDNTWVEYCIVWDGSNAGNDSMMLYIDRVRQTQGNLGDDTGPPYDDSTTDIYVVDSIDIAGDADGTVQYEYIKVRGSAVLPPATCD